MTMYRAVVVFEVEESPPEELAQEITAALEEWTTLSMIVTHVEEVA
jgi:hypothetical protein